MNNNAISSSIFEIFIIVTSKKFHLLKNTPFSTVLHSINNYSIGHLLNSGIELFLKAEGNAKLKKYIITTLRGSQASG